MFKVGILLAAIAIGFQGIAICHPLKEQESYQIKTNRTVQIGAKRFIDEEIVEHRCTEIDDHGTEHIEAKCLEGTTKAGDKDAESTKGETYNYFQNSHGQRFEYEEIRVNLKEDPIEFILLEIHAKLKDATVLPDETWRDKSTSTSYTIMVGQPKQYMKTECIEVIRKGIFTNGVSGEFKEDTWYRTSDGQMMSQSTTADHVVIPDVDEIQIFEKNEFHPEKT